MGLRRTSLSPNRVRILYPRVILRTLLALGLVNSLGYTPDPHRPHLYSFLAHRFPVAGL